MLEHPMLGEQAQHNTKEQFALGDFRAAMLEAVAEGLESYQAMAGQVLDNERVREGFATVLLDIVRGAEAAGGSGG